MKKYIAEAFGTFVLVFFGVGSAVLAGGGIGVADAISITGISLAFGISVIAMAYSVGPISGAHLNPAVSMGALVAGRLSFADFIGYSIGQIAGGIIAAGLIFFLSTNTVGGYDIAANGLGHNGWGAGYGCEFLMMSALIFEIVATAVLFPIVMSMGGIAGTQTLTLMVRGMATGQVSARNIPALLRKELAVGLLNGIVFSVVIAAIATLWYGDFALGLVMAAAILLNLLAGALAGALVPVVLKRMSIDPALAGGVVLTTVTDVIGILGFVGLATYLLLGR